MAQELIAGDAAAVAMGFPAMANPSAAEVQVKLTDAIRERGEVTPVDRDLQALLEKLRALRPQAQVVVDDLVDELRHSTRRLEAGTAREVMRSYGLSYETLPGETPEPNEPENPAPAPAPMPALLLDVATHPEELLQATAVHLLADLVDTLRRMDEPPRFGGIRTLAGLRERAVAIEAAYQRHILLRERTLLTLRFPPPPVPGSDAIVPLTDPGQLIEEGRAQRNCVASYAERVAAGKVFIYRVLAPERATLSLQPSSAREWELGQLLCACNQPVSPATRHSVLRWLGAESVSL